MPPETGQAPIPRAVLTGLAVLFAATAILYGSFWMYAVRYAAPSVELGFNIHHSGAYDPRTRAIPVGDVTPGSPAEQAGLKVGDSIVGINGHSLESSEPFDEAYAHGKPGDTVELIVERRGESKPLKLYGAFRRLANPAHAGLARSSALEVT